ncbi:peptide MFS transporter [Frigoriglobus tundricola]|uniref:Di-tripeptide/cation symporter n=1 Tax=Frigoriglobus tundricola TaxID=2774151 RepID=A0A6M5Z0L6_9BACT|nr:peptide MFS transporter [Frigoriglobus tundricola]QJW99698.1 Di-tripeptide/cation symporter [Frigoriglobus tundricola]
MRQEYWIMLVAWFFVFAWIPIVIATNRKVHPKVLFFLFMVELWERFSYYGMRAFLVLYLGAQLAAGGFAMDKGTRYAVYAAFGAMVYLTPLAGGFLADKVLGFRLSIIWGAVLMASGQFTLAAGQGNEYMLYLGLALLVTGNGFFKPNISSMIGKFYAQGDARRDQAFTIFYMGINIGAFISPLTCGAVAQIEGWSYGFLIAGTGMVTGLGIFLYTSHCGYLEDHADPPAVGVKAVAGLPVRPLVFAGTLLFVPVAAALIYKNSIVTYLLIALGSGAVAYMIALSFMYDKAERQRIWVLVILLFFTSVFWGFFELAGSALNVFTDENVDKTVFGNPIPASVFQAVNALFIVLLAPVFTLMWGIMARKNVEPNAPVKFAFGLMLLGVGFLILNLGRGAAVDGVMPLIFLILCYLFHTLGELALSPVGLSLVTKLAPARLVGFMMGFWFLSSAIGLQAGGWIAGESAAPQGRDAGRNDEQSARYL